MCCLNDVDLKLNEIIIINCIKEKENNSEQNFMKKKKNSENNLQDNI